MVLIGLISWLWLVPAPADAGVISGCSPATVTNAPNLVTLCTVATPAPGIEFPDGAVSSNTITVAKEFLALTPPVDIEFFPFPTPPGITEYAVADTVTNSTGVPWTSYKMELGTGVGAAFTVFTAGTIADFDVPDGPFPLSSTVFTTATLLSDFEILWTGGTVPAGGTVSFALAIDVDDLGFTFRQYPSGAPGVPGPPTAWLVVAGLMAALSAGHRSRAKAAA